jgi:hypothetical protein
MVDATSGSRRGRDQRRDGSSRRGDTCRTERPVAHRATATSVAQVDIRGRATLGRVWGSERERPGPPARRREGRVQGVARKPVESVKSVVPARRIQPFTAVLRCTIGGNSLIRRLPGILRWPWNLAMHRPTIQEFVCTAGQVSLEDNI